MNESTVMSNTCMEISGYTENKNLKIFLNIYRMLINFVKTFQTFNANKVRKRKIQ